MTFKDFIDYKIIQTENISLSVYQVLVFVLIIFTTWLVLKMIKKSDQPKIKKDRKWWRVQVCYISNIEIFYLGYCYWPCA